MEFWTGIAFGVFATFAIAGLALSSADDRMCSGKQVVMEKADTIRTFSCTVELKAKEKK